MTSKNDFVKIMAYITAGTQKSLSVEGINVYFDLLGDLPLEALSIAAKRAVLEHKYATFPSVAMLREFATDAKNGEVKSMTGMEAWGIAVKACGNCDIEVPGSVDRAFAKVPPMVTQAVNLFGFMAIYNLPSSAIETARAQFIKTFDSIASREQKTSLLPESIRQQLAAIGAKEERKTLPFANTQAIGAEKP